MGESPSRAFVSGPMSSVYSTFEYPSVGFSGLESREDGAGGMSGLKCREEDT